MRTVFDSTAIPLGTAKALSKALKKLDLKPSLGHCREAVAEMFGYADWHELERNCRPGTSPRAAEIAERRAGILAARFRLPLGTAAALVADLLGDGRRAARDVPLGPASPLHDRAFGMVAFDDVRDPTGGWTSVSGGSAARISGPHELSTSVVWLTNVSRDAFFGEPGEMWRNPWLRHRGYSAAATDRVPETYGPEHAIAAARNFAEIAAAAFALACRVEPGRRISEVFRGQTLAEDLRRLLPDPDGVSGPAGEPAHPWPERLAPVREFLVRGGASWAERVVAESLGAAAALRGPPSLAGARRQA